MRESVLQSFLFSAMQILPRAIGICIPGTELGSTSVRSSIALSKLKSDTPDVTAQACLFLQAPNLTKIKSGWLVVGDCLMSIIQFVAKNCAPAQVVAGIWGGPDGLGENRLIRVFPFVKEFPDTTPGKYAPGVIWISDVEFSHL